MPAASDKSIANEVKQRVPDKALSLASTPDRLLLRLNKYAMRLTEVKIRTLTYHAGSSPTPAV
jgi:hypothetical protein